MNGTASSPFALPQLAEIFNELRRGRHLCPEDGALYYALRDHIDSFRDLFRHLGFRLEFHSRDFYYFRGEGSLSDTASRMAVFFFILMEHLAGRGEAVEEGMMSGTFAVADLPHLNSDRYRTYMHEAGVDDEEGLLTVIRNLERFGFLQRREGHFRFRSPAYRFFDLCLEILRTGPAAAEPSDEAEEGK